jgi:ubiquinone/menaquinone biosynthesis C-methylase UbiE
MDETTAFKVFFELHSELPREGPGDNESTAQALSLLPKLPPQPQILDLGCGPGMQTIQLAKLIDGHITAVDIHQPYLDQLHQSLEATGLGDRVKPVNADMDDLPFSTESFDVIWAEGSAYILEFSNALRKWRPLLKHPGYLVASEVSWIRPDPPQAVIDFWQDEYPNLQSVEANLSLTKSYGYVPIAHFVLPESAWWDNYYTPLESRLHQLQDQYADNPDALQVLESHQREIDLFRRYSNYYGYVFYVLEMDKLNHHDVLSKGVFKNRSQQH